MSEKNKLAEKLLYAPKNGYDRLSAEDEKAMEAYCEDYKKFLNNGKTERLCVEYSVSPQIAGLLQTRCPDQCEDILKASFTPPPLCVL